MERGDHIRAWLEGFEGDLAERQMPPMRRVEAPEYQYLHPPDYTLARSGVRR